MYAIMQCCTGKCGGCDPTVLLKVLVAAEYLSLGFRCKALC